MGECKEYLLPNNTHHWHKVSHPAVISTSFGTPQSSIPVFTVSLGTATSTCQTCIQQLGPTTRWRAQLLTSWRQVFYVNSSGKHQRLESTQHLQLAELWPQNCHTSPQHDDKKLYDDMPDHHVTESLIRRLNYAGLDMHQLSALGMAWTIIINLVTHPQYDVTISRIGIKFLITSQAI